MNKYSNSCVHGKSKDVNKSWCDRAYAWSARVFGANGLCRVSARRVSQHFALVPDDPQLLHLAFVCVTMLLFPAVQ